MSHESAFDRLHPALQHHIVDSLGWTSLRPLQEHTIGPVLDGDHALLLAPTAGGKTEAAVFPLLSRMLTEQWGGLSVLYVCPIKPLLNNLESRLRAYGALVGRRVDLWHGDVGASRRRAIMRERPDLLLTTPESIHRTLRLCLLSAQRARPNQCGDRDHGPRRVDAMAARAPLFRSGPPAPRRPVAARGTS